MVVLCMIPVSYTFFRWENCRPVNEPYLGIQSSSKGEYMDDAIDPTASNKLQR